MIRLARSLALCALIAVLPAAGTGVAAPVPAGYSPASGGAPVYGSAGPTGVQRFVIVPGESQVTYRVGEVFISQGNRFAVAVGTTSVVRGEVLIDRTNPRNSRIGTITVDINQLRSDSGRRDNMIRDRWLESSRFPLAEFSPTAIGGLPETYADGTELALQVTGNLRIRDVTKPTTFVTTIRLDGNTLTGAAATGIRMTDFGFEPPSIFGILRSENDVRLEMRLVARLSP